MLKISKLLFLLIAFSSRTFATPTAVNGFIELNAIDFSANHQVELNGEWEFYPDFLIFDDDKPVSPSIVQVPGLLNKQGFSAHSYGTYKLTVSHSFSGRLGIKLPDIYTAYSLYLNGKLVVKNGIVARNESNYEPRILLNTVELPQSTNEVEIVIQVANYKHRKFGINDPIIIGNYDWLTRNNTVNNSIDIFLTGCLLMGGFFFLGLFYYGRKEIAALYFALFCICYAYRIIGWQNYFLHDLFPHYPYWLSVRVEYITMYLCGFFFTRYVRHLFPEETPQLYGKAVEYISLVWAALTIFLPIRIFTYLNLPWLLVALIGLGIVFITFTRAILKKRTGAKHSLYSVIGISLVFVLKTLGYLKIIEEPDSLTIFGQLVFFFFQGMILSELFSSSWKLAKTKAEEASQAKTDFLSIMSHEIRTPLNAVIGTTYHMIDEGPREDQKKDLNDLKTSSEHLLSLINNILDFNKIDAGKIELENDHVVIKDFIEGIVFSQKTLATEKGIKLYCNIDKTIPDILVLDRTRFIQIITNLVGNAIKFTKKGSVTVKVTNMIQDQKSCNLLFEVIDTGIGIEKDKHKKIFHAFEQGNTSVSRNYGGTGLGLSITNKLLQLMKATIKLESQLGQGSKFYFEVCLEIGEESEVVNLVQGDFNLEGIKVLLVEDNELNALIASRLLNKWKCVVDVAENGLIAVESNQNKHYDIILMDIQMPTMDGYTASRKIRDGGYDVPIIALTASAAFERKEELNESGIDDVVTKPFEPGNLYHIMRSLIDKRSSAA